MIEFWYPYRLYCSCLTSAISFCSPSFSLRMVLSLASCSSLFFSSSSSLSRGSWPGWPRMKTTLSVFLKNFIRYRECVPSSAAYVWFICQIYGTIADIYCWICFCRDRLGFSAEIRLFRAPLYCKLKKNEGRVTAGLWVFLLLTNKLIFLKYANIPRQKICLFFMIFCDHCRHKKRQEDRWPVTCEWCHCL